MNTLGSENIATPNIKAKFNRSKLFKDQYQYVYIVNTMTTEVVTARLPLHDTELINFFIEKGEFKSKSDFFRFAVKHTLAQLIQQYLDSMIVMEKINEDKIEEINKLIKKVREETWSKKYAQSLS